MKPAVNTLPEWSALARHADENASLHLRDLFAADPERAARYALRHGDLYVDYAKHRVTDETLSLLYALARAAGVEAARDAMFAGEKINETENRAVLHTPCARHAGRRSWWTG